MFRCRTIAGFKIIRLNTVIYDFVSLKRIKSHLINALCLFVESSQYHGIIIQTIGRRNMLIEDIKFLLANFSDTHFIQNPDKSIVRLTIYFPKFYFGQIHPLQNISLVKEWNASPI